MLVTSIGTQTPYCIGDPSTLVLKLLNPTMFDLDIHGLRVISTEALPNPLGKSTNNNFDDTCGDDGGFTKHFNYNWFVSATEYADEGVWRSSRHTLTHGNEPWKRCAPHVDYQTCLGWYGWNIGQ